MTMLPEKTSALSLYISRINRIPLLSREQEYDLAVRWRDNNDVEAAHRLVVSNLRFVVKVAYEYVDYGLKIMDLIQEGNVGLMQAVKKFDPDKGYRLISYAVWWIRAYILNFIIKSWSLVKIGTTQAQKKLFYKMRQVKNALGIDAPTQEEIGAIARTLDVKEDEVREMNERLFRRDLSLNTAVKDDEETTYIDLIAEAPSQETTLIDEEERSRLKTDIKDALTILNEKEQYIIRHRIMAAKPKTLQEIADTFKISRERVRQIEEGALKKLRKLPAVEQWAANDSM
jgi:RNA polymerase sigma-32 factor